MRHAARTDANHAEIRDALRAAGCSVADTGSAGDGFPDLVVGLRSRNFLLEIKDGKKPPSARKLTDDQVKFHGAWRGQVHVVTSVQEAIDVVFGDPDARWMP